MDPENKSLNFFCPAKYVIPKSLSLVIGQVSEIYLKESNLFEPTVCMCVFLPAAPAATATTTDYYFMLLFPSGVCGSGGAGGVVITL